MFAAAWFRMVRRIVLGDRARDDEDLTSLLNSLRRRANWAFFLPQDRARRRHLHERLQQYLANPENGSLVSMLPADVRYQPSSQIAQWLFAFDPAGMATFRTLALLASGSAVVWFECQSGNGTLTDSTSEFDPERKSAGPKLCGSALCVSQQRATLYSELSLI
jgi:hypothetical protein